MIKNQKLWGAIGVSGGTVEQDMEIASAAVSLLKNGIPSTVFSQVDDREA